MSASAGSTFAVALCQFELRPVDSVQSLTDHLASLLERAGPADCYVFPELLGVAVETDADDDEPTVLDDAQVAELHAFLAAAARERDAIVVGGSYNVRDGSGKIRNRSPIATPDGVETYDKRHPIPKERDEGTVAGAAPPPVVEHHGVEVGVLVCYDVEFPETVRDLVDRGAEVLVVPSWTASEAGYQRVSRCAAARAVENQCYVATVPLVSTIAEQEGTGRATVFASCDDVVGADGTRMRLPRDEEAVGTCTLSMEELRESRTSASVRPYTDARTTFR